MMHVDGEKRPLKHLPLRYTSETCNGCSNPRRSNPSAVKLVLAVFPQWTESEIECEHLKDGLTNTLIKVNPRGVEEAVLVRAYGNGTAVLIDRQREIASHQALAQHGLAPELLACFENGLIYRYIAGHVCTVDDLRKEQVWRGIAQHLAIWHVNLSLPSDGRRRLLDPNSDALDSYPSTEPPTIWTVMQAWIRALPADTREQRRLRDQLQQEFLRSARELDKATGLGSNGLVFAHCDLLSGNVIVLPHETGSKVAPVQFIDYEYAVPAPAAFDLANHFSEWGGVQCDYAKLPSRATREAFISHYLLYYRSRSSSQEVPSLQDLCREVDLFRGIPGLYWGIWALIQSSISRIEFDYMAYARLRLDEYFVWRGEQDGSRVQKELPIPIREVRWTYDLDV